MNKKFNFIFKKKKLYKIILYFLLLIVTISLIYFSIPKFFNYTPKLIEESFKKNSNFIIKNISNINYRFFPSPRIRLNVGSLKFEESILEVRGAEIDIVLNSLSLINYKSLKYNKLLIRGGSTDIKINEVNQLLNFIKKIKKIKKIINFKKNTIVVLHENKKLFEISDSTAKINSKNNIQRLSIGGLLLNHKIAFYLKNKFENESSISLKIPELDISTNILFAKKDNFKPFEGFVNLEILNNLFQFNFTKEKSVKINKGFARSNLIDFSFEGEVFFKPHFLFNIDVEPSKVNIEKLFSIIRKNFFSENPRGFEITKKINGFLNFKTMFEGNIIFENKEILFKNFKIGEEDPIFFNAEISEFGKKGKIQFNLLKNIQYKKNFTKELKLSGFIIPSSLKVTFKQVLLDEEMFTNEEIKNYEEKFNSEVINNSLKNIFNNAKMTNFFKNFIN